MRVQCKSLATMQRDDHLADENDRFTKVIRQIFVSFALVRAGVIYMIDAKYVAR